MDKTPSGWNIIDDECGVLSFTYNWGGGLANAFAARLGDDTMMVISPPTKFSDEAAEELAKYGEVSAVVAPNGFHHLGLAEWKKRYPGARILAAPEAAIRIAKKNPDAPSLEPISLIETMSGEDVFVMEVPNTKCGETWAWVRTGRGYVWFASDLLANMPTLPKSFMAKMLFKLSGSGPGYKPFNLAMKFMLKDKKQTLANLKDEMAKKPPSVVVPAHGDLVVGGDVAAQTEAVLNAALG